MNECQGCVAVEAAKMARSMWQAQHGREPKVDDAPAYLELVLACVRTLKGLKV